MKIEILEKLEGLINEFKRDYGENLVELVQISDKIMNACNKIERSWSGSFAGWHSTMYYKNFEPPSLGNRFSGEWGGIYGIPDGWHERTPEEVVQEIERLVGNSFSMSTFEQVIKDMVKKTEELQTEITVSLSALDFDEAMDKEREISSHIETFKLGGTRGLYVERHLPKNMDQNKAICEEVRCR